jgi:hypothetical protein
MEQTCKKLWNRNWVNAYNYSHDNQKVVFLISSTNFSISKRTDHQCLAARKTDNSFLNKTTLTASAFPLSFPRTTRFIPSSIDAAWNSPVPLPRAEMTANLATWNRSVIL